MKKLKSHFFNYKIQFFFKLNLRFEEKSVVTGLYQQKLCGHLVRDEIKERKKGKFVIVSPQSFSPTIVHPLNQTTGQFLFLVIFIVMSSRVFLDFYSLFLFRLIQLFLEHFYTFTCAIVLYRFCTMVIRHTCNFWIFIEKTLFFLHSFYFFVNLV